MNVNDTNRTDMLVKAIKLILLDADLPVSDATETGREWDERDRQSWEIFCQRYDCKYTPTPEYGVQRPIFRLYINDKMRIVAEEYARRGIADPKPPQSAMHKHYMPEVGTGAKVFKVDAFDNVVVELGTDGQPVTEVTPAVQFAMAKTLAKMFVPGAAEKIGNLGERRVTKPPARPPMRPPRPEAKETPAPTVEEKQEDNSLNETPPLKLPPASDEIDETTLVIPARGNKDWKKSDTETAQQAAIRTRQPNQNNGGVVK